MRNIEVVDFTCGRRSSNDVNTNIPFEESYEKTKSLQQANIVIAAYLNKNLKDINNVLDRINIIEDDVSGISDIIQDINDDITNINEELENIDNKFNGAESMGSIVVEDIECKNKFNATRLIKTDGAYPTIIDENNFNVTSTGAFWESGYIYEILNVKPNTDCTISGTNTGSIEIWDSTIEEYINDSNTLPFTFNPGNRDSIAVLFRATNAQVTSEFRKIQIEDGPVATSYTPYKNFKGRVDIITGQATPTNEYVDGKRIWVKRLNLGSCAANGAKFFNVGLAPDNTVVRYFTYMWINNVPYPVPYIDINTGDTLTATLYNYTEGVCWARGDFSANDLIMEIYYTGTDVTPLSLNEE